MDAERRPHESSCAEPERGFPFRQGRSEEGRFAHGAGFEVSRAVPIILVIAWAGCASTLPTASADRWRPTPIEVVSSCRREPDDCIPVRQLPAPTCGERDPELRWTAETRIDDPVGLERARELVSNDTGIERCWDAACRYCWPAAGRVELTALVAADGRTLSVAAEREPPAPELAACVAERVLRWTLPRSDSERRRLRVTLSFPPSRSRPPAGPQLD